MRLLGCTAMLALATLGCGLGDPAAEQIAPVTPPTGEERGGDDARDPSVMPEVPTPAVEEPAPVDETAARTDLVHKMIDEGMDVNKADADGRTALMLAAFDGYTGVVELLLDHGAGADRHSNGAVWRGRSRRLTWAHGVWHVTAADGRTRTVSRRPQSR